MPTNNGSSLTRITPCTACPLRGRKVFRPFTEEELDFVYRFKSGETVIAPGVTILTEGQKSPHLYTILSGWVFRYKTLSDGRRQILNFGLPGDLIGLQGSMFDAMDHSVEALTQTVLCTFPREKAWSLYQSYPGLAFDITWLVSREERMMDRNLLNVGRRNATERVAYVLLALYFRAKEAGLADNGAAIVPLTQQHLADALGLSVVHTNKVLQRLAGTGAMTWKNSLLDIKDEPFLRELSGYEDGAARTRPFI